MNLTDTAIRRPVSLAAIVCTLLVLGWYGFQQLPVDFLPSITYPMIKVHIWWRGATPEEITRNIAEPLERQMATVDDLDYLESSSIEGMYTLLVNFRYGTNVDVAYQDAQAALARARRNLPAEIDAPVIIKADPSQLPVVQVTAESERMNDIALRDWVENWLQDRLLAVPGVAGAETVGGRRREIRVHLDPLALEKYGLTLNTVLRRIGEENLDRFAGRVTTGPEEVIVRTLGEYRDLESLRNLTLVRQNGSRIRLHQVADVVDDGEEVRVITRLNGNPCVKLSVLKQSSANSVAVADAVARRLDELKNSLPEGLRLGMVENQADYIRAAIHGVTSAGVQAAILLIAVIYLFLGSWRPVLVMVLVLPVALIGNFALMKLGDFSLNIFSLAGLVVAIGVMLDYSMVVLENISRLRKTGDTDANVVAAVTELDSALLASAASFLMLFVPFLLVPGLTTLLFRELILVIAGIVALSLLVALTVTPALTARLLRESAAENQGRFARFFQVLTQGYGRILAGVLRRPWMTVLIFTLSLAVGIFFSLRAGSEFLPQMDDGRVMVKLRLPTGAALNETDRILQEAEKRLQGDPWIESRYTLSGGRVWGLYTYEVANEGEINIQLRPAASGRPTTREYVQSLRKRLSDIPVFGGKLMVMPMKVKGIRKIGDADIELKIRGTDMKSLYRLAANTAERMRKLPEFTNVYLSLDMSKPEYQVIPDRFRLAEMDLPVSSLGDALQTLISGKIASLYRDGEELYGIRLMIPESRFRGRSDVANVQVSSQNDRQILLSEVADVKESFGPVEIVRENQINQVIVRGDVQTGSVGEALTHLKKEMASLVRTAGSEILYGGQAQMMAEMRNNLLTVFLFALFFSLVVLVVQFNELRLPLLVMSSIPFCLAGCGLALSWSGFPYGALVIIGILVVVSLAISDAVLLFTFAEELRIAGKNPEDAVRDSAIIRFRPRVMTTVCAAAGLVPLAWALDAGSDMLQSMAIAALGGLGMEILVTLLLMPSLYILVVGREHRKLTSSPLG